MQMVEFLVKLDGVIQRHDLLTHPFYEAWTCGNLTLEDLQQYSKDYFHQVDSFPLYLAAFAARSEDRRLRNTVLQNLADEVGGRASESHSELWLDFAQGVGAGRALFGNEPSAQMRDLLSFFMELAQRDSPEVVLAAFYAYESQVPRIAQEKLRGLRKLYDADDRTCRYFEIHITADVYHSEVWRNLLVQVVEDEPAKQECALRAAETTAQKLWYALDAVETWRLQRLAS